MSANENQMLIEVFQPEISGEILQVTLEEVKKWIKEGKLLPNHKVRIKNLSWIEAQKIPAFQSIFEAKKKELEEQAKNHVQSISIPKNFIKPLTKTFVSEQIESKSNQTAASEKPALPFTSISTSSKKDDTADSKTENDSEENQTETSQPSIPFKIFEEKELAKTKKAKTEIQETDSLKVIEKKEPVKAKKKEPQTKPVQGLPRTQRKTSIVKNAIGLVAGCVVVALLSLGISYLWAYQLKGPVEVNEKTLPELASLEDKLTTDKLELRVKASKEQNSNSKETSAQQIDVAQEISKLENQFNEQRNVIIDNYRNRLADDDFTTTSLFSFVVLMVLFILTKIFYFKPHETVQVLDSPKLPEIKSRNNSTPQKSDSNNSQDTDTTKQANVSVNEESQIKTASGTGVSEEIHLSSAEAQKIKTCLLHRESLSKFFCETCNNYFCETCPQTIDEKENCCPFCKVPCKSADEKINNAKLTTSETTEKKAPSLLELGKDSTFTMYEYPDDRTRKLGIIPAFVISLFLSASMAIFWVYKITPYLENRGKEVVQNNTQNQAGKSAKSDVSNAFEQSGFNAQNNSNTVAQTKNNANPQANSSDPKTNEDTLPATIKNPANDVDEDLCMDPVSQKEFSCKEEKNEDLRRALHEHAVQVKSVEKARSEIKEKTTLILSLISPTAREELRKAKEAKTPPDPLAAARAEREKQQFIRVFIGTFLVVFLLLQATRFLGKDEKMS